MEVSASLHMGLVNSDAMLIIRCLTKQEHVIRSIKRFFAFMGKDATLFMAQKRILGSSRS
jgi:hypothetical protein